MCVFVKYKRTLFNNYFTHIANSIGVDDTTVVPVMNGHPRDQAKVSVHCRWPLIRGMGWQAGDAKYNTPCKTTYLLLSPPAVFILNTCIVIIRYAVVSKTKINAT